MKIISQLFTKIIGAILLILLIPLFLIVSIAIRIDTKGSVFFTQQRVGKNGKLFKIYKFRTMEYNCDMKDEERLSQDDIMITRVGSFLREWSIDELPQLINIIKGDMNFIGPRPTLEEQVIKYTKFQHKRHNIKPGITGYAQVNGRNSLTWDDKIRLDVYYIENRNIAMNIKILLKTFKVIFNCSDVYEENICTYENAIDNGGEYEHL